MLAFSHNPSSKSVHNLGAYGAPPTARRLRRASGSFSVQRLRRASGLRVPHMRTSRTRTAQSPRFPQPVSSHNPQACAPAAPPPARPCQPTKCHSTLQATQTFGPSVTSHTHASMIAFHMAWHGVRVRTVAVHPLQADTPRLQPCGPSRRLTVRLSRLEQIESLLWRTASRLLNLAQLHLVMNGYVESASCEPAARWSGR